MIGCNPIFDAMPTALRRGEKLEEDCLRKCAGVSLVFLQGKISGDELC